MLVVAVLLGSNEAVTPLGTPDAARETLPVNPPWSCTVIVVAPAKPTYDPVITGGAESANPGAYTVTGIVIDEVSAPDMPVMVTYAVPVVAMLLAVRVRVLLVEVELGLNEAVTPLGRPDAARDTLPANAPWSWTIMVVAPKLPRLMDRPVV